VADIASQIATTSPLADRKRLTGTNFSESLNSATFWVPCSIPRRELAFSHGQDPNRTQCQRAKAVLQKVQDTTMESFAPQ
jgi:hypothetical protein